MPITKQLALTIASFAIVASPLATDGLSKPNEKSRDQAGANLCEHSIREIVETRESIMPLGIVVANIHDFSTDAAAALRSERKMNERLQIVAVSHNSLAEKIGLQVGDIIMEFNGIYVPKGEDASQQLSERVLPQIDWTKPLKATILRDGYAQLIEAPENTAFAATKPETDEVTR